MDNLLIEKARRFMRRGLCDEDAGSWRETDPQDEIATMMAQFAQQQIAEQWVPVDREILSLRWILMKDRKGKEGIRLGRPEDGGWRLIDEWGVSTWQPHHADYYLAEMPLSIPTDTPYTEPKEDEGK